MDEWRDMKVLILSKKDDFAIYIMRCLSDLKAECHVFGQGMLWAVVTSKSCRGYTRCDFEAFQENIELAIEKVNSYCGKHKISFVLAADYDTGHLLSRIKARLRSEILVFPCAAPDTLEALNNKWKFVQMLKHNDLPYPRTVLVENKEQLEAVDMGFPCLVKPLVCEGGDSSKYIKLNKEDYLASGRLSSNFPSLVQEFIPGKDICLSILARQGKVGAWTMQEYINSYTMQFFTSEKLLDLGRRLVAATNYEGVACFDLRIDERDNSIKFIECNPRFWNSLRASWRNGVNFVALGIMLAEGKEIPSENVSKNILYFVPAYVFIFLARGKISMLKNLPEATCSDLKQMFFDPISLMFSMIFKNF